MGIIQTVREIKQALETLKVIGISCESERMWLENIERKVDELREYRRLEEIVKEFDEDIQIIYDRNECYEEELASLGNNWW